MHGQTYSFRPDVFEKIVSDGKRFASLVAYIKPGSILTPQEIEQNIEEFISFENLRKATYGVVVDSPLVDAASVRRLASNITRGRTTCVWCIAINQQEQRYFACHSVLAVRSTPLFEDECRNLIHSGMTGKAERKRYPAWLEFILFKLNPIFARNAYHPEKRFST